MIKQKYLKSILSYSPETGLFTRVVTRNRFKAGEIAGFDRGDGYFVISIDYKSYLVHRLAWLYMTGSFPKEEIDHINRNHSDNRFTNLREATSQQNNRNCSPRKDNKLGIKGVSENRGKFEARAKLNGKNKYLGTFKTKEEASEAYQKFAKQNHGEFYCG